MEPTLSVYWIEHAGGVAYVLHAPTLDAAACYVRSVLHVEPLRVERLDVAGEPVLTYSVIVPK